MTMSRIIRRTNVIRGARSDSFYPGLQVGVITDHVITLTASQIHAMYANPIVLLPSPQPGRAWWVHFVYLSKPGANYSGGGSLDLRYDTDPPHTGISGFPANVLRNPSARYGAMTPATGAVDSFEGIRHAPIILANANQAFTGAGGDVTITLTAVLVDLQGHTLDTVGNLIERTSVITGARDDDFDPLGRAARFHISRTTVTPAQFVLLRNQPVQLLGPPPAGTWYQVEGVLMEKTSSVGYGAGNAVRVRYIGGGDVAGWLIVEFRGGARSVWGTRGNPAVLPDAVPVDTGGLEVYNVSTDFALDGGPIDFSVVYCLVDT